MIEKHTEFAPGLILPKVLTGLWQIADMEKDGKLLDPITTAPAMAPYVAAGLFGFDMADHYGSAEVIAGTFRKTHPLGAQTKLLTKWVPKPGLTSREATRAAVELAMQRLQVDQIDLMQFHAWHYPDPSWLDQLFWLHEMQEEGAIAHLGLTNFDAAHLRVACASGIKIISNQVCHSLLDQRASGQMREVCELYGVKLLAFGTLAGGFLTDKWLGKPEPKLDHQLNWSQMKYLRFVQTAGGWAQLQQLLQVLKKIADSRNVSIANVATRFIMEQEYVGSIIIGARLNESAHIEDTLKLFEFSLSPAERKMISEAQQLLTAIPGDCGDEYRKPPFLTASGDLSHHLEELPKPYPVQDGANGSQLVLSGTSWESLAGYSRAIRKGNRIWVSGTTATHGSRIIGGNDPTAQTHFILDKIEAAITSLGGSLHDVVRTRIFVNDLGDWEAVARAHGQRFGAILPANTLVEAKLVGEGYKVEIEAEAELI
jgi:aryl-alcohol dehydrogenase-like predicted oxidoreductase/enamine deaminase RidA (YjgF/YER057c/UK114 family)